MAGQTDKQNTVVWLVEDNDIYRESITALLSGADDIECPVSVPTCEALLKKLAAGTPPDMVLMDIGLPAMDGIEGTRQIRSLAPATRVIMLTVHDERDNIFQAIAAGATGYLLKSARGEEILEAVRAVSQGAAPVNGYIARKMLNIFSGMAKSTSSSQDYQLTPREREVLQLLVEGLIGKQIADRMDISFHTVDTHVRNIYEKLHVNSRGHAVAKALREGLV